MLALISLSGPVLAEEDYHVSNWTQDVKAIGWESGALLVGVTAMGMHSWEWGSSRSFRWQPEGWFAADTYLGGSDKLGHAYTSYAATNVLFDHLTAQGRTPERAMLSAVWTTQAIMTYMEVLDGFSKSYGFSPEDMVMNLLGSGMAYLRATRPGMRDIADFRLEYELPGYRGLQFRSNYLLALKMSGFASLQDTPLRYVELHAGYYTRGYIRAEQDDGYARSRHVFVGVGLNVTELLLGRRTGQETPSRNNGRLFLEHVQLPYAAARLDNEL